MAVKSVERRFWRARSYCCRRRWIARSWDGWDGWDGIGNTHRADALHYLTIELVLSSD